MWKVRASFLLWSPRKNILTARTDADACSYNTVDNINLADVTDEFIDRKDSCK